MKKIISAISFLRKINVFFRYLKDEKVSIIKKIKTGFLFGFAALYLLSPIDLIPDMIFGLGLIDDGFILVHIFNMLNEELKDYDNKIKEEKSKIVEIKDYIIKDEN
ncbi:YkvA family protein [Alkalithermobacter paradoxus]|uniref:DUF1232 domain-containing protein n=1 Tax=Alkalithermobacter paradoxus TaxID=29349 RepID=A0A1V4IBB2_9FIRM|nr:hypothetical protein CLOTH_01090 [[Clostridium] thermoalcaliphilum]